MKNLTVYLIGIVILLTSFLYLNTSIYAILRDNIPDDRMLEDPGIGGSTKSPYSQTKEEDSVNRKDTLEYIWDLMYNFKDDTVRVTPTPAVTGVSPSITISPGMPNTGNFVSYRQCNYRSTPLRDGCNMCTMGCGITSAAMVASTLLNDSSLTPPTVLQKYTSLNQGSGCYGSSIMSAKTVLESYGFQTTNYIFRSTAGENITNVADEIRSYVKNGWYVFTLAYMCRIDRDEYGCGHFFVITDIDENNRVSSYDPYYEPNSTIQPIDYSSREIRYRIAFAVKKKL